MLSTINHFIHATSRYQTCKVKNRVRLCGYINSKLQYLAGSTNCQLSIRPIELSSAVNTNGCRLLEHLLFVEDKFKGENVGE